MTNKKALVETGNDYDKMEFSPIYFDDGKVQYSSEDVKMVVDDYYRQAENSINDRRNASLRRKDMYYNKESGRVWRIQTTNPKVQEIMNNGDYEWIIEVARSRNEIDPNRELRLALFKRENKKTAFEEMIDYVNTIARKPDKTYEEMSRANFNLKLIKILSEQPRMPTPSIGTINNITQINNSEKPAEKVPETSLKDIRAQALKDAIDVPVVNKE